MVEEVTADGVLYALVVRAGFHADGTTFFTSPSAGLQLGYMAHPSGHQVPAHTHRQVRRTVAGTQEVLLMRSGEARVDIYDLARALLSSITLRAGDVILLAAGGHALTMLTDGELVEVKQGPYPGPSEKQRFTP